MGRLITAASEEDGTSDPGRTYFSLEFKRLGMSERALMAELR
jgi:hypothetical protein